MNSERSRSARPGPVRGFRGPTLPYVPAARQHEGGRIEPLVGRSLTIGPVKDGFSEGRSGLRVSPSPERFEPIWGVNGKPLSRVSDAVQLPAAQRAGPSSERQLVASPKSWPAARRSRPTAPIAAHIVAVEHHLRLVAGPARRSARNSYPGSSTRCSWRGIPGLGSRRRETSSLQRVVAAVAFRVPEESARTDTDWAASRTGMYCAPCGTVLRVAPLPPAWHPLALAQICAGMVLGSTLSSP